MLNARTLRWRRNLRLRLARPVEVVAHERLRLRALFAVALFKLFNLVGGAWDIQWHVAIGRDSLWIPPHLLVMVAFVVGVLIISVLIAYESALGANGQAQPHALQLGPLRAPPAAFGIFFGYLVALMSAGFDEWWHRTFGIDATLWSPPHLMIMLATMLVDFSLILGIAASSQRLGYSFTWKSLRLWGLVLTGAYAFEAVNFQMAEAFIVGYRHDGVGLYGLLFPIMVGAVLPLSLLMCIRLAGRFWVGLPIFALALGLQYLATGVAAAGFAILKPVPVIELYIRQNPYSTAAMARAFARQLGFNGLIGFEQAWTMMLSGFPLLLVALLGFLPWARRHMIIAAPVYSAGMVLGAYAWFRLLPALSSYPTTGLDLFLGVVISVVTGVLTGSVGLWLARRVNRNDTELPFNARVSIGKGDVAGTAKF